MQKNSGTLPDGGYSCVGGGDGGNPVFRALVASIFNRDPEIISIGYIRLMTVILLLIL